MKLIYKILIGTASIYLAATMIFYLIQEKLIFHNERLSQNYKFHFTKPFEEIFLKTNDKNQINGILFNVIQPKGVILYFHGNAGSLKKWGTIAENLTQYQYDVFIIDYRSYGKSTGDFDEEAMYQDATLAYEYVKKKYGEDQITLFGRSLGGTFAIRLAATHHPKQLILEAPFYNLKDAARYHYPFLPYQLLMKYHFNSDKYIAKVNCKTTIFHGTKDRVIPISSSKKLYVAANSSQIEWVALDGATHHNCSEFGVYLERLGQLLE